MPAVGVASNGIAAFDDQLDRPIKLPRRPKDKNFLRVHLALHTEATAHIWRYDSEIEFRNSQNVRRYLAQAIGCLCGRAQREALPGLAKSDNRTRLDRICSDARVGQR